VIAECDRTDWRSAVDLAVLGRWMDRRGLGDGPIEDAAPIGGGTQNILLRFSRGEEHYVLRRPPIHKRAESDEVMRREMRVLAGLQKTSVPHPALIAGESDEKILGSAFYLMRPVDGFNPGEGLPPQATTAMWQKALGDALIDDLFALGAVPIDAIGLGDLSHRDGWLERQVPRWRRLLDGYARSPGWTGTDALPSVDPICAWLEGNRPDTFRPGLVHGDYHLGNVLCRPDRPEIAAIVDWELATIGDPLLDLGWLLATWPEGDHPAIIDVRPWSGFPSAGDLRERYLSASGRSAVDAHWFAVLACFKLAVLLEGTHARACAGQASVRTGDRLHRHAMDLLARASHAIQPGVHNGF